MAELKTKKTAANVYEFVNTFADTEQKKQDSFALISLIQEVTGFEPAMWGPSIIGFGQYHYKSEKSKQEGDWPLVGFSPRKAAISLYVYAGCQGQDQMLEKLGKIKKGKGCIYIKKLTDIDTIILKELINSTVAFLQKKYKA